MLSRLLSNRCLYNQSFPSVQTITNTNILDLFKLTNEIRKDPECIKTQHPRSLGLLFFQPSTRTRMSFEIAAKNMGYNVLLEANPEVNSAMAKQETLHDVLKTMSHYVDAIVLRHPDEQEVFHHIKNIDIPIINGGWGNFEHPTQALIDLYTFYRQFPKLDECKLAIVGDPNTRTSRSITQLASRFSMSITIFKIIVSFE